MNAASEDAISAASSAADSIAALCDELYDHIGKGVTLALVDGIKALAEKVDRLLAQAQAGGATTQAAAPPPAQGGACQVADALLTAMGMGESLRVLVHQLEELDDADRFAHQQAMVACIDRLLAAVIPAHAVAAAKAGAA